MKKSLMFFIIFVILMDLCIINFVGCSGMQTTQPVGMLDTIDRHVNHLYTQCQIDATNFPIFFSDWKNSIEPQLLKIKSDSRRARNEFWTENKIRADILPNLKTVHNQVYAWGMRIVEVKIP
jgi:hypothetical protein